MERSDFTLFLGFSCAPVTNRDKAEYARNDIGKIGYSIKRRGGQRQRNKQKERSNNEKVKKSSFSRDITEVFGAFVANNKFLSDDNFAMLYPVLHVVAS